MDEAIGSHEIELLFFFFFSLINSFTPFLTVFFFFSPSNREKYICIYILLFIHISLIATHETYLNSIRGGIIITEIHEDWDYS